MTDGRIAARGNTIRIPRVMSSSRRRPVGVGVWVVDGAARTGRKRTALVAETAVSAGSVGPSSAESVRVLAFGEGARGLDDHGYDRGVPLGHGDRARR
jgi:hypothetical protein